MEKMTYRQLTETLASLAQRLDAMDTFLTGVVAILGKDEVLQAYRDQLEEEARKIEETLTAQVEMGVKDGWLKPVAVSGLKSLVVGVETSKARPRPTRMQIVPEGLRPQERGVYLGRQVGEEFVVPSPIGPVTTKVTAVYKVDDERRAAVIAEHQAKLKAEAEAARAAAALAAPVSPILGPNGQPAEVEPTSEATVEAPPAPDLTAHGQPPAAPTPCTLQDPCFEDGCQVCGGAPTPGPERGRAARPAPQDGTDLV